MNKRALNIFAAIVLAVFMLLPAVQPAAAEESSLKIDQVYTCLPEMKVVFHYSNGDSEIAPVELENYILQYKDKTLERDPVRAASEYPLEITFLIDVSTSMNQRFNSLKEKLKKLYNTKEGNAKYRLVTMGEARKPVLDGSESTEEALKAIDELQPNDQSSVFWEAVGKEVANLKEQTYFARRALFIFTDGEEYNTVGETNRSEIETSLKTSGIPVYMFAMDSKDENTDTLAEIARMTGGDSKQVPKEDLNTCLDMTMEYLSKGFVLSARTDDLAQEEGKIILKVGESRAERMIDAIAEDDQVPPEIEEIRCQGKELTVIYSEPVKNADLSEAYTIKRDSKEYKVESIRPVVDPTEITIVLVEPLYNGDYTLTANGVTDMSATQNLLEEKTKGFTIDDQPYTFWVFLADCWIYLLIAVVVCAGVVIAVVLLRRKKNAPLQQGGKQVYAGQNNERVRIEAAGGKDVKLSISGRNLVRRDVKINVAGTIIIGRLASCDVSIDDAQVSRQNTALIYQNNKLYVRNLSETNGTMLNGVALREVRELQSGDTLIMGDTKIVVTY